LIPNTGPTDGSRRHAAAFCPIAPKPSTSEIADVVFPSPAGVGVIEVTQTSLPSAAALRRSIADSSTLAAYGP
jgi:hypothetical protein